MIIWFEIRALLEMEQEVNPSPSKFKQLHDCKIRAKNQSPSTKCIQSIALNLSISHWSIRLESFISAPMATGINLKEFAQCGHCQLTINVFPKQFNNFSAVNILFQIKTMKKFSYIGFQRLFKISVVVMPLFLSLHWLPIWEFRKVKSISSG